MNDLTIEISSYPKSGNTWVRHIFREVLRGLDASRLELPVALHQMGAAEIKESEPINIPLLDAAVRVYKSHIFNHPDTKPNRILYVYRHPLDVLFSALNFHATQSLMLDKKIDLTVFKDRKPKLVKDILSEGDVSYYYDRFLEDAGASLFSRALTGSESYFDHVLSALECQRSTTVRYEDMCKDVSAIIEPAICRVLGVESLPAEINYNYVERNTKGSERRDFFWRASSGGYLEILSENQVDKFNNVYSTALNQLGYLSA